MRVLLGGSALWLLAAAAQAVWPAAASAAQEARATPDPTAEFERHLRAAREGPLPVRSQAAARLVALGDFAAERLEARFASDLGALAAQGQETVEVLARFDDPELRALCWRALDEPDFPWRPAALRSLTRTPHEGEHERFVAALEDPLAAVRVPAIDGLHASAVHAPERHGAVVDLLGQRLADEDDRVRRQAALALDALGRPEALLWPLEDLARDDRWFELETGRAARYDAARRLTERLGDVAGYAPEQPPSAPANVRAREALRRTVLERAARAAGTELDAYAPPELPPVARAPADLPAAVLGLELRSCRRGELLVALGSDHVLRFGTGVPLELPIGAERAATLVGALEQAYAAAGERRDVGRPGCDLEVYRLVAAPNAPPSYLRLLKGPEPVPDLRPDALRPFLVALLAAVRDVAPSSSDPRAADLAERLVAALAAVGGPPEEPPR